MKKTKQKKTTPAPSTSPVNSGAVNVPTEQPAPVNAAPAVNAAPVNTASPEPAAGNAPAPVKAKKASKPKAPSISASVRRLVVRKPEITVADLNQALIDNGWKQSEIAKRSSTISTLRTDTLAVISIAKQEGCWAAPQEGKE